MKKIVVSSHHNLPVLGWEVDNNTAVTGNRMAHHDPAMIGRVMANNRPLVRRMIWLTETFHRTPDNHHAERNDHGHLYRNFLEHFTPLTDL